MTDHSKATVGIGIDFGTSNSVAAIYNGEKITLIELEANPTSGPEPYTTGPTTASSTTMPSATYIDREFQTCTGQQAINTYIAQNQGRKVELSLEVLGEARTSTGQIDTMTNLPAEADTNKVYGQAFNDGSLPGRLFRGTKRLLGNASLSRVLIFDRPFRLVALITPILLRIRQALEETLETCGLPTTHAEKACIGHPVNFEGHDPEHNQIALKRLTEAYQHAAVKTQSLYPEPAAAALSYLHYYPGQQHNRIMIVDFGGGTLDFCILGRHASGFNVINTHGIGLGGDHIDQALFRKLIFPLLGKGERWKRTIDGKTVDTLFPFDAFENLLLNWAVSYMLNQNEYTSPVLDKIHQQGPDADKFRRLYELITQNYCYQVFQAIKDCKADLSIQQEAKLDIPEIDVDLTVKREEFEDIIASRLDEFTTAVNDTLIKAGLNRDDIDLVIRTGGSSQIPAVRQILEEHFPDRVIEHDAFTSVAAGLAIADYNNLGLKP